jgi:hypothetical protein
MVEILLKLMSSGCYLLERMVDTLLALMSIENTFLKFPVSTV